MTMTIPKFGWQRKYIEMLQQNGPMTKEAILDALGITEEQFHRANTRLRKKHHVPIEFNDINRTYGVVPGPITRQAYAEESRAEIRTYFKSQDTLLTELRQVVAVAESTGNYVPGPNIVNFGRALAAMEKMPTDGTRDQSPNPRGTITPYVRPQFGPTSDNWASGAQRFGQGYYWPIATEVDTTKQKVF